jgi:hypothetical protein
MKIDRRLWRPLTSLKLLCRTAACALLVSACTAQQPRIERADPGFAKPSGDNVLIEVARGNGDTCSSSLVQVFIDDEYAGAVEPGGVLQIYVTPIRHVVGITANARCLPDVATRDIDAGAPDPIKLKVGFSFFGHIRFIE